MANTICFEVWKNTLRRTGGLDPVSSECNYSAIECRLSGSDWDDLEIVTAGFFVTKKQVYQEAGNVVEQTDEDNVTIKSVSFSIPTQLRGEENPIYFGLCGSKTVGNRTVTVATNVVALDVTRGVLITSLSEDAQQDASNYEQLLATLNTGLSAKMNKLNSNTIGRFVVSKNDGQVEASSYSVGSAGDIAQNQAEKIPTAAAVKGYTDTALALKENQSNKILSNMEQFAGSTDMYPSAYAAAIYMQENYYNKDTIDETKRYRAAHPSDTTNSQNSAKGNLLAINDLLEAINSAGVFSTEKVFARYTLTHNADSVLQSAVRTTDAMGGDVYGMTGIYQEQATDTPFIKTKSFSGWTSKARLILSGHCHCDRLNKTTLVPSGDNFVRGTTSYAIAYTGAAAYNGYKDADNYYIPCFGTDGEIASWGHIETASRTLGTVDEQLMDVWIVGDTYVKRVRFGAGRDSQLLATEVQLASQTVAQEAHPYYYTKAQVDDMLTQAPPAIDLSAADVTLSASSFVYDGTSKAPNVQAVTLNGTVLTPGTDYAVVAAPATNAGSYIVTVTGIGGYSGTATANWTITKAQATISGESAVTITGTEEPVTKIYTTDGDGAFSFAVLGNIATVSNTGGTVTITPTAAGTAIMTVTLSDGANYFGTTKDVTVTVEQAVSTAVFGVMWNYALSSPALARLTPQSDPLGVVTHVPATEPTACVGTAGGQSDFDNYLPWSGMVRKNSVNGTIVDFTDYSNHETYVYIPPFWSKMVNDVENSRMYFYISDAETEGFTLHPGSDRYVGRYECQANYLSLSGETPKTETTIANFRSCIASKGNGYFQYDIHTHAAIQLLYIIEFANFNSQSMIGAGISNANAVQQTGQTDALTYHTGRASGADAESAVQYRWIENLWGNVWKWVDGALFQNSVMYMCSDPTKYASTLTGDYVSTGLTMPSGSTWLKINTNYDNSYFIPSVAGGSDTTYLCDCYYDGNGDRVLRAGSTYSSNTQCGLFAWSFGLVPNGNNATTGGRTIRIINGGT